MAGKTSDRVADQRKEIVDHVIEEMGKGGFSWLKPWADSASPHNPVTGSTDLAEQMAWECSTERTELAEVLWNGDPEQGIAALEDVAVDDDDCIKQEWMGYKPGTPRFEVWKDFETNFSKDGVSLCELSGFDDYKVEYKDPGPTLSKSEFDKLFSSDVLDENVQKDVSDVNRDDLGSEDER